MEIAGKAGHFWAVKASQRGLSHRRQIDKKERKKKNGENSAWQTVESVFILTFNIFYRCARG